LEHLAEGKRLINSIKKRVAPPLIRAIANIKQG
jgi:hypothetical protein